MPGGWGFWLSFPGNLSLHVLSRERESSFFKAVWTPGSCEKIQARENRGGLRMPGEGANSRRQNRRWFLRGPIGIHSAEAGTIIILYLCKFSQAAGVASRRSGECFKAMLHPPTFWRGEFAPSPGNKRGFHLWRFNFFTASRFRGGDGRGGFFRNPSREVQGVMNQKSEIAPDSPAGDVPADPGVTAPETEFRVYIRVWLGIVILTGITFTLSRIKAGGLQVLLALLIAGTQSALALYYFMHLRDERAPIFRVLIPLVLVILVVLLALTFSDVAFRG